MAEGWSFPSNNYGQISGIGEAGIETFRGTPFRSLAREICQNSLDARADESRPVIVEFALSQVATASLPDFGSLRSVLDSCYEFWQEQGSAKTIKFFTQARKLAARLTLPVLRISDYNTTGLSGSNREYNTPWQNLVKAAGVSAKGAASGGSFGIGKSAPFACSELRTVFYATRDAAGLEAFQGIARLVSFRSGHALTTGTGYYGQMERNRAVPECRSICPDYRRRAVGTDVFVVGLTERREWEREIIAAVLDDFLLAIYEGALEVRVGGVAITAATLAEVVEEYRERARTAYNYYLALTTESAHHVVEDFAGLGDIEVFMLIGSGLHRRVLMSRGNGMKIFDQKNFPSAIPFAGICILRGVDINAYFRELENPQHDAWEPERGAKPAEAKRRKQELFRHLKEMVLELGRTTPIDEADAEGVGEYLPDDVLPEPSSETREDIREEEKKVEVTLKPVHGMAAGFSPQKGGSGKLAASAAAAKNAPGELDLFAALSDTANDTANDGAGASNDGDFAERDASTLDDTGSAEGDGAAGSESADSDATDATADDGSERDAAEDSTADSDANNEAEASGSDADSAAAELATSLERERERPRVLLPSQSVRLIMVDGKNSRYRLNFLPLASATDAVLTLKIAGEQGGTPVEVHSAKLLSTREELSCSRNNIFISHLRARARASVEFYIAGPTGSMEVNLYGHTL